MKIGTIEVISELEKERDREREGREEREFSFPDRGKKCVTA